MKPLAPAPHPVYSLRLSLTDRCQLRCPYCLPGSVAPWPEKTRYLSPEQIARAVESIGRSRPVKIRLTGGEPLLRAGIETIAARLGSLECVREVALTTNALTLNKHAEPLLAAGVSRLNIHVDSLRPGRFRAWTGGDLEAVLDGLHTARGAGFRHIKVNMVVMRGMNDDELMDFCEFARREQVTVRFIELMDTGCARDFHREHLLPVREFRAKIRERFTLEPMNGHDLAAPAREFRIVETGARIGFIGSDTEPFCAWCNRIRLSAQGRLYVCLYDPYGADLAPLLHSGGQEELDRLVERTLKGKVSYHPLTAGGWRPRFSMSEIGG
ncbi:MAG: GTP 3',8-cyclase 1 [Myxococcota bacterium]|nr:GTP 3',8-cyclase 1 [Myxococcota bacterium]